MKKSTSIHSLNGDRPFTKLANQLYFLFNKINNAFPNVNVDPKISQKDFKIKDLKSIWGITTSKNSPSRKLSDFFWHELPWGEMKKELGKIKILDIGAGTGRYAESFMNFSKGKVDSYLGIDVYDDPKTKTVKKKFKNVDFKVFDGKNIEEFLMEFNMITSQSAFEHIPEDLNFFRQIAKYVKSVNYPIIQVHLLPSSAGLKLYRQHGIRQYTPRNISKITRLFGHESNIILYSLGGQNSVNIHYNYITKPLVIDKGKDLRDENEKVYNEEMFNAMVEDEKDTSNPAFYALIIVSNTNTTLFE